VPPRYPWADVCLPHKGFFMLAYLQPLCNGFPVCPPPVRRRPAAASRRLWDHPRWVARLWRMLDRVRAASLQRSLSAARGPHVPRSTPHHALTCLDAPMPCATPRLWWTPPAVSVCHPHGPHTPASAARPWQSSTCASRDPRLLRSDRLGASRRGTARCSARPWPRGAARPVLVVTLMPEVADASALRGRWDHDRRATPLRVRVRGLPAVWRRPHGVRLCAVPAPGGGAGAVWQRRVLPAGAEVGAAPGGEAAAVSLAPTEARVMPMRTTRSDLQAQAAATRAARPVTLRQEGRHA